MILDYEFLDYVIFMRIFLCPVSKRGQLHYDGMWNTKHVIHSFLQFFV